MKDGHTEKNKDSILALINALEQCSLSNHNDQPPLSNSERKRIIEKYKSSEDLKKIKKIQHFWKQELNSGKQKAINPNGSHSPGIKQFLNHTHVYKTQTLARDKHLLNLIKTAPWEDELFQQPQTLETVFNLFIKEQITPHQKWTLSSIIQNAQIWGNFQAFAFFDKQGHLSTKGEEYLEQVKSNTIVPISQKQIEDIIHAIRALPLSEQFIFLFYEQKMDISSSYPSPHSYILELIAEPIANFALKTTLLQNVQVNEKEKKSSEYLTFYNTLKEFSRDFSSKDHPAQLRYSGILTSSFGIINSIGYSVYGQHYKPNLPRLNKHSINDIEAFSRRKRIRLTDSPDSMRFELQMENECVHSVPSNYPSRLLHDKGHSLFESALGQHLNRAFFRIVDRARACFGIKWSTNIWWIVDKDFPESIAFLNNPTHHKLDRVSYTSRLFFSCLSSRYNTHHLSKCDELSKQFLLHQMRLFPAHKKGGTPLAQLIVLDIVFNPDTYRNEFYIVVDESIKSNFSNFYGLWDHAKWLIQNTLIHREDSIKLTLLRFNCWIELQIPVKHRDEYLARNKRFKETLMNIDMNDFETHRDNTSCHLGFKRKAKI